MLALAVLLAPVSAAVSLGTVPPEASSDTAGSKAVPGEFIVRASAADAAAAGFDVLREVRNGWTLVREPVAGESVTSVARTMSLATGLQVEPNRIYEITEEPLWDLQWSMENVGQSGGTVDADIDIEDAWTISTGSPDIVVAVLDTGVQLAHPDIAANLWTDPVEVSNGIDDDGNGYIDDIHGWDAVDGDPDPHDTHGHGTFVSTTAIAPLNGIGMAGVAPDSTVMPIRVCGDAACPLGAILEGMDYAIENDADVINLSLGDYEASPAFEEAIIDAVNAGIVVVAASGNDGVNVDAVPFYPASHDINGLISVGASNHFDGLASFSNYGTTNVDLAAPGESVVGGMIFDTWVYGSGTSFAAPKVAGVAALILAEKPDLEPLLVADLIRHTVDIKSALVGTVGSRGRLNAATAVESICYSNGADGDDILGYHPSGDYRFVDVGMAGCVVEIIKMGAYGSGWSHIEAVDLSGDGDDELVFYRKSDGRYVYYELTSSGGLGAKHAEGYWGSGWDAVEPVNLDGDAADELMFYRKSDGRFGYYNLTSEGVIGSAVRASYFGAGWTSLEPVDIDGDGDDEMMFYRKSDGRFAYYNLKSDGTIGTSVRTGYMGLNWDLIEPTDLDGDGTDEMVFYRASDGRFAAYDLNLGGYIGSSLGVGYYEPGLVSITSPLR